MPVKKALRPDVQLCIGDIVREHRAFMADAVDIRRLADHQAAMVDARLHPADVVAHDEQDVGLRRLRPARMRGAVPKAAAPSASALAKSAPAQCARGSISSLPSHHSCSCCRIVMSDFLGLVRVAIWIGCPRAFRVTPMRRPDARRFRPRFRPRVGGTRPPAPRSFDARRTPNVGAPSSPPHSLRRRSGTPRPAQRACGPPAPALETVPQGRERTTLPPDILPWSSDAREQAPRAREPGGANMFAPPGFSGSHRQQQRIRERPLLARSAPPIRRHRALLSRRRYL